MMKTVEDDVEDMMDFSLSHHMENEEVSTRSSLRIAKSEDRWVRYWRIMLMLVLLAVAVGVSVTVFLVFQQKEEDDFHRAYEDHAKKILGSFKRNAVMRLSAVESLAVGIASSAKAQGQVWPNVTFPDFEQRVRYVLDLAWMISLQFYPIVQPATLDGYNAFTVANQGWLQEGLDWQEANRNGNFNETFENAILPAPLRSMTRIPNKVRQWPRGQRPLPPNGPYIPLWQICPVFPAWSGISHNSYGQPTRRPYWDQLLENQEPLVTTAFDYTNTSNPATAGKLASLMLYSNRRELAFEYEAGPVSDFYWPIFEEDGGPLVGALSGYVYWQVYFENILPGDAQGMMAVLENNEVCGGQSFTYLINGPSATYIGPGDLSEPEYHEWKRETGFGAFLNSYDDDKCHYNVKIYPSKQMEDGFTTSGPMIFAIIVAATFVFTSCVFLGYDSFVEVRQKAVMKTAVQSTEVVNTLFPEPVRNRLFDESTNKAPPQNFHSTDLEQPAAEKEDAIADLYENCTVFFADIAGFTAWSGNNREPKDVFKLLEALYGVFDKIAAKRAVFKVETIGDCYLAITGVPKPQKDHAVIMAKFAAECMTAMNQIIHNELIHSLGADTADLQMRVGIHSGPVTAGVLRGERARFQLFGDTVNTASRMESNGLAGRIQASMSTTELLIAAGKKEWLEEREGGIEAKGKGRLRTFWVTPRSSRSSIGQRSVRSSDNGHLGNAVIRPPGATEATEDELVSSSENGPGDNAAFRSPGTTDEISAAPGSGPVDNAAVLSPGTTDEVAFADESPSWDGESC
ncbi:Receptor-type guanylate cyclase gcy [Seminavis robusta]|uniref:Receptor-type guanylate cyclase gcy n=1 Tax=Seminavis robusta TaxID=568900 RepID=A0A9N8HER5_9STRA|nr:Receptor-type guanylate cyclase gcy [Seminavis robusta]|eukprot:Sro421_g139600.1 Receptor-type guanylate cyclase gcy (798) ;mRNA; r:56161-59082